MNNSKQKIGILTFHKSRSYGAVLQCYALFRTLKDISNADVGVIDFYPPRFARSANVPGAQLFYDFSCRNLSMLTEERAVLQECLDAPKGDSPVTDIVVGSDQVWNPDILKSALRDYFLCDSFPGVRKHAYAASFGLEKLSVDEETAQTLSQALASYSRIGVREKSGVDICRSLGREEVETVVDPTLLADPAIFESFVDENIFPGRVCGFFLAKAPYQAKMLKKIAKSQNTKPYYLARKAPFFSFIESVEHPEVEAFVSAIHNASGIVTDSFHGTCFSIIFRRQFVITPSHRKERFVRLAELLKNLGLEDRIIADYDIDKAIKKMKEPIDYDRVHAILKEQRANSRRFVQKILDYGNEPG